MEGGGRGGGGGARVARTPVRGPARSRSPQAPLARENLRAGGPCVSQGREGAVVPETRKDDHWH